MILFKKFRQWLQDPKADIRNAVTIISKFAKGLPEQERIACKAQLFRIEIALRMTIWKRIMLLLSRYGRA